MPSISVFTLNCWGIGMGVSRDRVVRMRAIAEHLAAAQHDIVCLQEIWCPTGAPLQAMDTVFRFH